MGLKRKNTLSETAGFSKKMLAVADALARKITGDDTYEILGDTGLIDDWHEGYSETYDSYITVEGQTYDYEVFYDSGVNSKNGEASSDLISINFALIERTVEDLDVRIGDNSYDEEDEEFNAYDYAESFKEYYSFYRLNAYQAVFPVILHELTHTLNPESDPVSRLWIKSTRWNEEDVRNIIYLFSTDEMNARVASASAVFLNYYRLNSAGVHVKNAWESGKQNRFFSDVLMPNVLGDRELQIKEMETWVGFLGQEVGKTSQEYLQEFIREGRPASALFSLPFHLAINEDRLYKRSNPRSVLAIYARDPEAFENKVYNFYNGLLQKYKQRIYKACWYTFNNYEWNDQSLTDWIDSSRYYNT